MNRFHSAGKLASYAGTTPRLWQSGARRRHGPTRPDVNRYLKWALVEAASTVGRNRRHWPERHQERYDPLEGT